ncbi:hypothetical protein [Comamonas sp. GB3 AK4-5]|uniref:hypothetical protein n=1 Tax=Comamonas sp. GB3 AK4-5 TaxID=3231487 RepID=UPI00351E8FDF
MPPPSFTRRHHAITAEQAVRASPTLTQLVALTQDSKERLRAVLPLVPPALRHCLEAGPIEGSSWCVLVRNNAAATKLRYLLPGMEAHLRVKGWDVQHIRIKVSP